MPRSVVRSFLISVLLLLGAGCPLESPNQHALGGQAAGGAAGLGGNTGSGGSTRGAGGQAGGTGGSIMTDPGTGGAGSSSVTGGDPVAIGGVVGSLTTGGGALAGAGGTSATGGAAGGSVGTGGATSGIGGANSSGGAGSTATCGLPATFAWSASDVLVNPISDANHSIVAMKEPTTVFFNNKWHLYTTVINAAGNANLGYLTFPDWSVAGSVTMFFLDNTPAFSGTHSSPQLFYFRPQSKWYLISQSGAPMYSTANDPSQTTTWTTPKNFFSGEPAIVTSNKGAGAWTNFWVICDTANCSLFFSDDNGHWYRSQTPIGSFPNGFGTPVIVMQDANKNNLLEASSVYKIKGSNKYLAVVEAVGTARYFRSWTAPTLDGTWTALTDTQANPFAGFSNITFNNDVRWTSDISHGEILRDGYDETMTVDTCKLQYLFQGRNPNITAAVNLLPWKLGILTKTN